MMAAAMKKQTSKPAYAAKARPKPTVVRPRVTSGDAGRGALWRELALLEGKVRAIASTRQDSLYVAIGDVLEACRVASGFSDATARERFRKVAEDVRAAARTAPPKRTGTRARDLRGVLANHIDACMTNARGDGDASRDPAYVARHSGKATAFTRETAALLCALARRPPFTGVLPKPPDDEQAIAAVEAAVRYAIRKVYEENRARLSDRDLMTESIAIDIAEAIIVAAGAALGHPRPSEIFDAVRKEEKRAATRADKSRG